jgi:hypothetical protein
VWVGFSRSVRHPILVKATHPSHIGRHWAASILKQMNYSANDGVSSMDYARVGWLLKKRPAPYSGWLLKKRPAPYSAWGRRGWPILIADAVDQIERLTYCLANATKEHLVTRPERWPGAHAAKALCGSMTDRGLWINRTKLDALKRRAGSDERLSLQACTEHVTLRLSKLPCLSHLTDVEYQTQMKAICRDISDEAAEDRRQNGLSVLGVKRLLRYSPQHVPERMDKTPAPPVHSCCPDFRIQFKAAYRDFVDGYREALQALSGGLLTPLFPQGGLPPGYSFEVG